MVWKRNALGWARLGLSVSKRLGKATRRNRFRRIAREVFRRHPIRDVPVDVLVIAKKLPDKRLK
ncbi:MAG: ribonuclease P protein component, partial [Zetaproteobacteria bacterium]